MIASAHYTISDLNDPVQQGTAPASPVEGMLWLDTSAVPIELKRWDGTQWTVVNDLDSLSIGGRNILLNSAKNFPNAYAGATFTKTSDVAVEEWACTDALRIAGTGGTDPIVALFNDSSHGLATRGENRQRMKSGQSYTYSVYIKNNSAETSVRLKGNGFAEYDTVAPGEITRWSRTYKIGTPGDGVLRPYIQFNLQTVTAGDAFDVTFWHPQIELGNTVTAWTPAPEDAQADLYALRAYAESIEAQVDGKIDTWFYAVAPSASVPPESGWSTAEKAEHVDDLYYDTSKGYCYRYTVSGSTYSWKRIKDSDITSAMSAATSAQDTADNKRRVFTMQPAPPYDVGDMWVGGENGDIRVCTKAKTSGSYAASDWGLASKYTDDTAVNNLAIGGRNLMLNTAKNFPKAYQDVTFTKTSGVTVEEWACNDAMRIAGDASGAYGVFALFNNASHGLSMKGVANYWRTKQGQDYVYSLYLKNNHATNSVRVRINGVNATYTTIAPGGVIRWWATAQGDGSSEIQINLVTTAVGDAFDVTFWHPMIEYGNKPSDWSPAPEDVSAEISDAAGAVQDNLDNLSIGGRNYLRAMDGISLVPTAVRCSYTYDANTGTYELIGQGATGNYAQIYCNKYNRIDVPARLIGQTMLFHVDEISCSNAACNSRIYLNFMDDSANDSDAILKTFTLSPATKKLAVTVPSGTTWMRATLRMDENLVHADGDIMIVRGLMLEEGTHQSGWVPAEEDMRQELQLQVQSVSARLSEEANKIRGEVRANYVLESDLSQLAQTVSTIAEQTENNYTWSVNRINQLQTDMDSANQDFASQLRTISTYMTFGEDGLSIGKTGNPFTFRVSNDRLVFYNNNAEVAYLSNNKLYITHAEVLTSLILGRFAFVPQTNGNMSLILNS